MAAAMVEAGIAVKALLQGATPERKQEIEDLWDRYAPKVCVVEGARGVDISAGKGRILFDHKTLEATWLLGFNGWRSIETDSPAIILAGITVGSLKTYCTRMTNLLLSRWITGLVQIPLDRSSKRKVRFTPPGLKMCRVAISFNDFASPDSSIASQQ